MKTTMTLPQALAIAVQDNPSEADWRMAESVFKAHKLCPNCACHGEETKLGRFQESTQDTYAGRECPNCEEFVPDRGQDHRYEDSGEYDTDASGMCFSDADPGL